MAGGPIRRKTEKAIQDRAGVPVLLFYDEINDKTIMARANADGHLQVVGEVTALMTAYDGSGDQITLSAEEQNNQNQLMVNSDDVMGALKSLEDELRIMNFHLSIVTDTQIRKSDIGDN